MKTQEDIRLMKIEEGKTFSTVKYLDGRLYTVRISPDTKHTVRNSMRITFSSGRDKTPWNSRFKEDVVGTLKEIIVICQKTIDELK